MLLDDHRPELQEASAILDIAPQSMMRKILHDLPATYVGLDIETKLAPTVLGSITRLPLTADSIDVIVCMHVLEHIPDDRAAIGELARVLSPPGVAFVQVPRKRNVPTDENPSASVEERIERFGQDDHVRYYGSDFEQRLRSNGLNPSVISPAHLLTDSEIERFGLLRNEELWICSTSRIPDGDRKSWSDLLAANVAVTAQYERLRSNPFLSFLIRASRPLRALLKRLRQR